MGTGAVRKRGVSACRTTSGKAAPMSLSVQRIIRCSVPMALTARVWKRASSKRLSLKLTEKVQSLLSKWRFTMEVMQVLSSPPLR